MAGAWNVLTALLGTFGVLAFWVVVIFVIPGLLAVYGSSLLPLTGQWRKKWSERQAQKKSQDQELR